MILYFPTDSQLAFESAHEAGHVSVSPAKKTAVK